VKTDVDLPPKWKSVPRSVIVTGCAGFLGSTLSEVLARAGHDVVGVDCFSNYYDPSLKRENVEWLLTQKNFRLVEADLNEVDLLDLLGDREFCFHFAAQAGVRSSWGAEFDIYLGSNIKATQRLLEATAELRRRESGFARLVNSSSSSVYGNQPTYPVSEDAHKQPFSPYGVTKLAAEQLCVLYGQNFDVPSTSLRYFTVYGPRQRPDMAFRKFLEAARRGESWKIYGDGQQTRDFTYVADAVRANLLAADESVPWSVYNVGGGSRVVLADALGILRDTCLEQGWVDEIRIEHVDRVEGDVLHTGSDGTRIREAIGFEARTDLRQGLECEVRWLAERLAAS
jgi:nucleoside-diphosphate-sugar epimerase